MDAILIVDDEKDNLEALRRLLRNQYEISLETSPFEALKLVQKKEFSVIVSDQRMPEMEGVDLLEKVKQISPFTTRILLTGYTDMAAVVEAVNRGQIYRYVAKPWDPNDLRVTLKQAAEAYHLKRELEVKNRALEKSNEELRKAFEGLQSLDKAKGKFLSLISHELNTPLTVLVSFTELLRQTKGELSPDIQKAVESLSSATSRFSEIINEVLLYVKVESDPKLHLETFDLNQETKLLAVELSKSIKAKKLHFAFKSLTAKSIKVDAQKMRMALKKLIEHTVAHCPKGETFKVTVSEKENEVSYSVLRKGTVLSSDVFSSLIAPEKELHHHQDLGLALAICRVIVESHGAKVELIKSDAEGTEIALHFPAA